MRYILHPALLLIAASASAATRYVDMSNANPAPPYTSWVTAAQVIREAVNTASPGTLASTLFDDQP